MRAGRIAKSVFVGALLFGGVGLISGCGSGGEEIPLAKVPPPPEGFLKSTSKANIPKTGSPTNATELRR
jgi:hypothetical protein